MHIYVNGASNQCTVLLKGLSHSCVRAGEKTASCSGDITRGERDAAPAFLNRTEPVAFCLAVDAKCNCRVQSLFFLENDLV